MTFCVLKCRFRWSKEEERTAPGGGAETGIQPPLRPETSRPLCESPIPVKSRIGPKQSDFQGQGGIDPVREAWSKGDGLQWTDFRQYLPHHPPLRTYAFCAKQVDMSDLYGVVHITSTLDPLESMKSASFVTKFLTNRFLVQRWSFSSLSLQFHRGTWW